MKTAVLPGSFDPPTNGHLNLIKRASSLFDELHVVIAVNHRKKSLFTAEERQQMIEDLTADCPNVTVAVWDRLIVEYLEKIGTRIMIRGVRALADFSYEFELAMTNKELKKDLEVVFLPTDPKYFVLRSSAIKEIAVHGGEIHRMVPENVAVALKRRLAEVDKS